MPLPVPAPDGSNRRTTRYARYFDRHGDEAAKERPSERLMYEYHVEPSILC